MTVGYLEELAEDLREAAMAALVLATTGHAPPATSYISHGPPHLLDHCCDAGVLTVHLEEVTHRSALDFDPAMRGGRPCALQAWPRYVITLGRCSPTFNDAGGVPTAQALDNAASDLLIDLWALLTELYDRAFGCTLFSGQTACEDAEIGGATPLEPEGGCAGWEVRVTVGANDAGPVGS